MWCFSSWRATFISDLNPQMTLGKCVTSVMERNCLPAVTWLCAHLRRADLPATHPWWYRHICHTWCPVPKVQLLCAPPKSQSETKAEEVVLEGGHPPHPTPTPRYFQYFIFFMYRSFIGNNDPCLFRSQEFICANCSPLEKQELEAPAQVETTCIPEPAGGRKVLARECVLPQCPLACSKHSRANRTLWGFQQPL